MGVITAREFHLNKSKVLSRVEAGETIEVTKHGRPVARISPFDESLGIKRPERGTPEWQAAYDRMVEGMKRGFPLGARRVTYEDKHGPDDC